MDIDEDFFANLPNYTPFEEQNENPKKKKSKKQINRVKKAKETCKKVKILEKETEEEEIFSFGINLQIKTKEEENKENDKIFEEKTKEMFKKVTPFFDGGLMIHDSFGFFEELANLCDSVIPLTNPISTNPNKLTKKTKNAQFRRVFFSILQ